MEFMSKSGFVCEDERRKNVRKPRSKCVEDVFSACLRVASLFSGFTQAGESPGKGRILKGGRKGNFFVEP